MSSGDLVGAPGPRLTTDTDLASGHIVGEYAIDRKIGEGGFGTVYRAQHPVIGKLAAIKVLSLRFSADATIVSRFVDEARAVNQINHHNIIDIFSFGSLPDGRFYYVMELLDGEPLDRALAHRGRFAPESAIRILAGVARALDAAHEKGIVHRDLKPENVFLTLGPDQEPFPKLLDFGIAKLVGETTSRRTQTGAPIGTPYYMSPEQCRGTNVDHRTDVYSFGVMAFELLAGRLPFEGETHMDLMTAHVATPPPNLSDVCPDLPRALDAPVARMLAKRPEDRPASVGEALRGLALAARQAGLAIDGAWLESRATPAALVGGAGLDQVSKRAIESAATVGPGHSATTLTAATTARPPSPKRWVLVGAGAVSVAVVASGVGIAVLATRAPVAPIASERPLAAAAPSGAPAASSAAPATPSVALAPSEPELVALTIDSTPPRVTIKLGERALGTAPGPVELPRSSTPLTLTFEAAGYKATTTTVTPTKSDTLRVELVKVPSAPAGGRGRSSSDLEF